MWQRGSSVTHFLRNPCLRNPQTQTHFQNLMEEVIESLRNLFYDEHLTRLFECLCPICQVMFEEGEAMVAYYPCYHGIHEDCNNNAVASIYNVDKCLLFFSDIEDTFCTRMPKKPKWFVSLDVEMEVGKTVVGMGTVPKPLAPEICICGKTLEPGSLVICFLGCGCRLHELCANLSVNLRRCMLCGIEIEEEAGYSYVIIGEEIGEEVENPTMNDVNNIMQQMMVQLILQPALLDLLLSDDESL